MLASFASFTYIVEIFIFNFLNTVYILLFMIIYTLYYVSLYVFRYRYADRSYRTHPRGLIIYGPATVVPSSNGGNVSSTTILSILAKGLSNSSRFEPVPTKNLVGNNGTGREFPVANATNNATIPRCPLIPPNLGKFAGESTEINEFGDFLLKL